MDYFTLLGLLRGFDINSKALEAAYFAKQREHHPDRFATAGAEVRASAMQQAANVNEAYRTLKDPLSRARYLLGPAYNEAKPDEALLMEVMENREALEMADSPEALRQVEAETAVAEALCLKDLAESFAKNDINAASRLTLRLSYIHKQKETVRARLLAL